MRIQDDVEFLTSNMEYIVGPDDGMKAYFHHRFILYIMFMLNLFFETILTCYLFRNKEFLLIQLNEVYRGTT